MPVSITYPSEPLLIFLCSPISVFMRAGVSGGLFLLYGDKLVWLEISIMLFSGCISSENLLCGFLVLFFSIAPLLHFPPSLPPSLPPSPLKYESERFSDPAII